MTSTANKKTSEDKNMTSATNKTKHLRTSTADAGEYFRTWIKLFYQQKLCKVTHEE